MRWLQERLWFRGERMLGVFLALLLLVTVGVTGWRLYRWSQPIPKSEARIAYVSAEDAPVVDAYTQHPKVQQCMRDHEAYPLSTGSTARLHVFREPRASTKVEVRITTRSRALDQCLRKAVRGFDPHVSGAYSVFVDLW